MKHARDDYNRIQDPTGLIPENEPVFLLRAQDQTSAQIVRLWASAQRNNPKADMRIVTMAERHADLMDRWRKKKWADL
uniref:Uncharacterized protein n=1 Tax=viral metagenome TaxID=1070528 RepID=A0A6H2A5N3_9ZZZZ